MTLKNNRAPLLSNIKLYASFHHHMWIQTGVTVRKRLSWVVTSVTLTFDLWPWPFAWTLLWSLVITPENFMMIWWWEHSQKGVTDGRTDGRTDRRTENTICRAAWSQLKIISEMGPWNTGKFGPWVKSSYHECDSDDNEKTHHVSLILHYMQTNASETKMKLVITFSKSAVYGTRA